MAFGLACTLVSGFAFGYWSIGSVPGGNGQAQAATVGQGATPTTTVAGNAITVSWAASTLSNGQAVNGYNIKRYSDATHASQTILSACTGNVTALSCVESNVPAGDWVYTVTPVFATNWLGAESQDSDPVNSDGTAPENNISLSGVTGGAYKTGNSVFYRGAAAGSLSLSNAVTDSGSGPASSATAALGGTAPTWTHAPSTVSTPAGGPFVSNPFSWTAGSSSAPTEVVTGRDFANNTAPTTLSFVNDSTAPTGNIAYSNGNQTGRRVVVTFSANDGGSGVASHYLQRASAPLSGGTCGTFTSFSDLGAANPTSPYTDTTVTTGNCYMYKYVVTDKVGNQLVADNANVAKVGYAGAVAGTAGLLSHWRLGEGAASSVSADSFTDTTGTEVKNHVGETGATWTAADAGDSGKERIGADGRAYRDGKGIAVVHTTATPASVNYSVEADLHQKTLLSNDTVAVIGRIQGADQTLRFYSAGRSSAGAWQIGKAANTTLTPLATASASALTVGQTYRIRLEMTGTTTTTLKLFVNGVEVLTANDSTSPFTVAGKAGIMDGMVPPAGDAFVKTASRGLHFDNFQVKPSSYPRAADSKGSNTGDYMNGPTLGMTGAFSDNTAARFDGVNDYMQATGTTGIPVGSTSRSVEMWFKTSSSSKQVLFSYGSYASNQEFGLWLNSGGATMTAWGYGADKTFTLGPAVNDGQWHQVVKTYDGTDITLYVDGASLGAQAAARSTTMDPSGFVIGGILNPASADYGNFFNGKLDEVSLYSTVLSQATVTSHYELVDPVANIAPTGASATLTTTEDTPRTLTTANFGFGDALEEEPHTMLAVKVTTLPASGTLQLNGTTVTTGHYVPAADIASGLLVFHPAADGNGTPLTSFTFQVQDNGGTANGGVDLDASPDTLTFNVTAVNDNPSFTKGADQNRVGDTGFYSIPNWGTDVSAGPADEASQTLTFTTTTPQSADLFTVPPSVSSTGTLTYTLKPGATGTKTVTVKLKDNGGGGPSRDESTETFTITVIAPNTAPVNTVPGSQSTVINTAKVFSTANSNALSVADSDAGSSPIQLQVISTNGRTTLSTTSGLTFTAGANGTATMTFTGTQTAINTALNGLSFAPTTSYSGAASLRLVLNDLGNTGPGGAKSDDDTVAITVNALSYGATINATTGLVNYYRLDETSGTSIADSEGTNTGALFATPALNVAGAITGNTAINFDKATDYGSIPRQVQNDLSIEFWFKSSQGTGTGAQWWEGAGLVDADSSSAGANDFGVALRSDGKVIAGTGNPEKSILSSAGGYNDNQWHHVVFTRQMATGSLVLYVDGAVAATGTSTNTGSLNTSAVIHLGKIASRTDRNYAGALDEVATYNTVLSAITVTNHYNAR